MRPFFRDHIKHIVRDGGDTWLWFDDWLPLGPIQTAMGDRVIYDAGLPRTARVSAIIRDNTWHWPVANSPELITLKETTLGLPPPDNNMKDRISLSPTTSKIYTTASAWNLLRDVKGKVIWHNLVWFSGHIPKAAFILWLAVKQK